MADIHNINISNVRDRLSGLRIHSQAKKQANYDRLMATIEILEANGVPVSAATIRAESGMEYNSYARNPDALALFREHSAFLASSSGNSPKSKRSGLKREEKSLSTYSKAKLAAKLNEELRRSEQLVEQLNEEIRRREELEAQYLRLLQERVTCDVEIISLQAQIAQQQKPLDTILQYIEKQKLRDK